MEKQIKLYLRKSRKSQNIRNFVVKSSSAKMLEKISRKVRNGEKIYGASSLFIEARGLVSRNCLDITVAINLEDACPLQSDRQSQPASPRG
jgi:hypothetical protein